MKKVKTTKLGTARLELYSDDAYYIILFKCKDFTKELLKSTFRTILTDYFDNIKITDERVDAVQFCYSHNEYHYVYFEFNYATNEMHTLDVNLNNYSIEVQEYSITGYYDSLKEVNKIYGKDANQIIAECIFENSII